MVDPDVLKTLAVTAKVMGTELDKDAARMFAEDLSLYPSGQVIAALARCRREVKGRLTVHDVVSRLDDGRPGPEEAWAMLPKSEHDSVVWCEEMAMAFGVSGPLMDDPIAARMAFKETYTKAVQEARSAAWPAKWSPSYGFDRAGRAKAVREAVERGRIGADRAMVMLTNIGPEYADEHRLALEGPVSVSMFLTHIEREKDYAE